MIEIPECMNDLAEGAMWRGILGGQHLAKIKRVWRQGEKVYVGFHTWDYVNESRAESFTKGKVMRRKDFEDEYRYDAVSGYNTERERVKTDHLMKVCRAEIVNLMATDSYKDREECQALLEIFEKLVRRQLASRVEDHAWNDGCAAGCCGSDPYDVAGVIVDEMDGKLTQAEIERLMQL